MTASPSQARKARISFIVALIAVLFAGAALATDPGEAAAVTGRVSNGTGCGFKPQLISPELIAVSRQWRSNEGPLRPRRYGIKGDVHRPMPKETVRAMLVSAWKAFGFRSYDAERYATRNMRQIRIESAFIPYILQSRDLKDANQYNPAGGLFQFIPESFAAWRLPGYGDRFNPLANIIAAVNAQVNADRILAARGSFPGGVLDGRHGGWGMSGTNPCRVTAPGV